MQFSIVIPLYNKENSILLTLNSVINQTYKDFEVIVIDDGSKDNSLQRVKEVKDDRIRIITKENEGVSKARNVGIKNAKYSWIAFLDADDLWKENHLETIVKLHERCPEAKLLTTSFCFEDEKDKKDIKPKEESFYYVNDYYERLYKGAVVWTSIAVVNKECFDKCGYFKEYLIKGEDLDMWSRIIEKYLLAKTNIITAYYRREILDKRLSTSVNSVKKYEVYYFCLKNIFNPNAKTRYQYHVIWTFIKHFIAHKQYSNLLLIILKYNFKLLFIFKNLPKYK